jgi:hypothetical protein
MAAVPIIMGVSAIAQGVGSFMQGSADADAADKNAARLTENARTARQQAAEEERRYRISGQKQLGGIRANYGASGISSSEGSALDVLQESAQNIELDALEIRHQGELKAQGYTEDAATERDRAGTARTGRWLFGASSILKGGADSLKYAGVK